MFLFESTPINTHFPVTVAVDILVKLIVTISAVDNPLSVSIFLRGAGNDDHLAAHAAGANLISLLGYVNSLLVVVLGYKCDEKTFMFAHVQLYS